MLARIWREAAFVGGSLAAVGAYARFVEPRLIAVTLTDLVWRGPALRVIFLTDFHVNGRDARVIDRIVRKTNALAPDIVLLGGDYVDELDARPEKLDVLARLAKLSAPLGVFGVLGNHDSEERGDDGDEPARTREPAIRQVLEDAGVAVLENEHIDLGGGAALVGISSWRATESDPASAFAGVPANAPTIVLAHNWRSLRQPGMGRFDLALAGHTHGGQACIPFTEVCPFIEEDMPPYRAGLYDWEDPAVGRFLYVSRGLGTSGVRARLGARPEIAVLNIRPG